MGNIKRTRGMRVPPLTPSPYDTLVKRITASAGRAPEAEAERWRGVVPDGLLAFWRAHGCDVLFGDGLLQLCAPSRFAAIMDAWFDGDTEFNASRPAVVAYTSRGGLVATDGTDNAYRIDAVFSEFTGRPAITKPGEDRSPDALLARSLILFSDPVTMEDELHEEAVAAHGALQLGEVFGYFPALALGGTDDVANVRRVDAAAHVAFLQQLGPLTLVEFEYGPGGSWGRKRPVRTIGRQM